MNYEIDKALHNYGYRYIGTIDNIRIYGKPIGYASEIKIKEVIDRPYNRNLSG